MAKASAPNLPGVEDPGRMIVELATRIGQDPLSVADAMLYYSQTVTCPVNKAGELVPVTTVPGHLLGSWPTVTPTPRGPQKKRVMVLTSHPNTLETRQQEYMCGAHGEQFRNAIRDGGEDPSDWYITSVIKYDYPMNRTAPLKPWTKENDWLLRKEIERVDPDLILAMGQHAVEALFPKLKMKNLRGSVQSYGRAQVCVTYSAHGILKQPELQSEFFRDIANFCRLLKGQTTTMGYPIDIALLDTEEKLSAWVDAHMQYTVWGIDCEWGGKNPIEGGLRLTQLCHKAGEVAVIHHRSHGWPMPVVLDDAVIAKHLKRLLCRPEVRIIGHFARSDLLWLDHIGVSLIDQLIQGFDTILGYHALYPNNEMQLELMANKLIASERYDYTLREWAAKNKKDIELHAYASAPDNILIPYGAHDVDKTFRCAPVILQQLNAPDMEGPKRLVFGTTMPAGRGIFEMEKNGLLVDMDRFLFMEERFKRKAEELEALLRAQFNWPDFNPNSSQQKVALLFGEQYTGKRDKEGKIEPVLPEGVVSLGLEPVKTTGKPAKLWDEVVEAHQERLYTPSTDDETLGILAAECDQLSTLRDWAYLNKAITSFMAEPIMVNKQPVYAKGIQGWRWPTGYVHTHLSQTAETGRWKSFDPNMQNLPSQRERDFKRIFDDADWPGVKSCFIGDPDMPVMIETDLKAAEVRAIAELAHDETALHILTNPKRDIHSEMAIKMFKLPYNPDCGVGTKKWMGGIETKVGGKIDKVVAYPNNGGGEIWISGKRIDVWSGLPIAVNEGQVVRDGQLLTPSFGNLRTAAKTIIFGIPYQRGAKAVSREIAQFGVTCNKDDAQAYIDEYLRTFDKIASFIDFCKASVAVPGYLDGPYGRRRWFYNVSDRSVMSSQKRQACNWPVQGLVAEYISVAVSMLAEAHRWSERPFRLKLAVHDSTILACAGKDVPYICEQVVVPCMSTQNVVPKLGFSFGVEMKLMLRLSEHPSADDLENAGVSPGYKCPET